MVTLAFAADDLHKMAVALLPCISADERRPYLHGVLICNDPADPQGFRFVATDGHKLGLYIRKHLLTGRKPAQFSGIMDREAVDYFASVKPHHYTSFKLEIQGRRLTAHAYDGTTARETRRFEMIDGSFPDWERCLPIHFQKPLQAFRARYVADIAKAVHKLSKATDQGFPSIAVAQNGNGSMGPAWLLTDIEGLRYVIMPQSTGRDMQQAPKLEDRPLLQRLQAVSTLLWQIKLTAYPELTAQQRDIDAILSRMIDAIKKEKESK